jgi:hypothetical protein
MGRLALLCIAAALMCALWSVVTVIVIACAFHNACGPTNLAAQITGCTMVVLVWLALFGTFAFLFRRHCRESNENFLP